LAARWRGKTGPRGAPRPKAAPLAGKHGRPLCRLPARRQIWLVAQIERAARRARSFSSPLKANRQMWIPGYSGAESGAYRLACGSEKPWSGGASSAGLLRTRSGPAGALLAARRPALGGWPTGIATGTGIL